MYKLFVFNMSHDIIHLHLNFFYSKFDVHQNLLSIIFMFMKRFLIYASLSILWGGDCAYRM